MWSYSRGTFRSRHEIPGQLPSYALLWKRSSGLRIQDRNRSRSEQNEVPLVGYCLLINVLMTIRRQPRPEEEELEVKKAELAVLEEQLALKELDL